MAMLLITIYAIIIVGKAIRMYVKTNFRLTYHNNKRIFNIW